MTGSLWLMATLLIGLTVGPALGGESAFGRIIQIGESLSDIVKDSEGGTMPSQEGFNTRGAPDSAEEPASQEDMQTPGRVTAWAFGVWSQDGSLLGGRIYADADDCTLRRAIGKSRNPTLIFGPCMEISHGSETL